MSDFTDRAMKALDASHPNDEAMDIRIVGLVADLMHLIDETDSSVSEIVERAEDMYACDL